jgi:fimbrial chaperone protein
VQTKQKPKRQRKPMLCRFFFSFTVLLIKHLVLHGIRNLQPMMFASLSRAFSQMLRGLILACAMVAAASSAGASGLQVSPINMALANGQRAGVFTLSNTGTTPINAQARIYKWTQSDSDEFVLVPSNEVIISPPIMQLAPGASQEIRVLRMAAAAPNAPEQHYRLIVDELPSPTAAPKKGISLLIRHNIPVFVNAQDWPTAQLDWKVSAKGEKTRISIHNTGAVRAQIGRIWLEKDGKEIQILSGGLTGYALPGSTIVREFALPLAQIQATGTQLKAQINGQALSISLAR